MPEHETYDYDGALEAEFERLHRDIASSSNPPGAAGAVALARHRRRTTIGSVAAIAAVAVIATSAGIAVHRHSSAIGPADGSLPDAAPLTPAALNAATSGWTSGWVTPTKDADIAAVSDQQLSNISCLDKVDTKAMNKATARGGGLFATPSGQVAYLVGIRFSDTPTDAAAAAASLDTAAATCGATTTTTVSYDGGAQVSFYEVPGKQGQPDIQLWSAHLDDRLALMALGGAKDAPTTDTVARIDVALMAALQSDATFVPDASLSGGVSTGSSSGSSVPDVSFGSVPKTDIETALGSWDSGLRSTGASPSMPTLPCGVDSFQQSSSGGGSSVGSNGMQFAFTFDSPESAAAARADLVARLTSCATPYTVGTVVIPGSDPSTGTVTVATRGGAEPATLWVLTSGPYLAELGITGGSNPPQSVSAAIGTLLAQVLADPQPMPSDGVSVDPQKQGEPAASSSSSAAAPQP